MEAVQKTSEKTCRNEGCKFSGGYWDVIHHEKYSCEVKLAGSGKNPKPLPKGRGKGSKGGGNRRG